LQATVVRINRRVYKYNEEKKLEASKTSNTMKKNTKIEI
jgi:hypothetical protein